MELNVFTNRKTLWKVIFVIFMLIIKKMGDIIDYENIEDVLIFYCH